MHVRGNLVMELAPHRHGMDPRCHDLVEYRVAGGFLIGMEVLWIVLASERESFNLLDSHCA
jgi:hypothetical protein